MNGVETYEYLKWSDYFSMYIFRIDGLKMDWVTEPLALVGLIAVILAGIGAMVFSRKSKELGKQKALNLLGTLLLIIGAAPIAIVIAQNMNATGLRWYSTMYIVGYAAWYTVTKRWIQKKKIMLSEIQLESLLLWVMLGMIIGARLTYVFIYNWDVFKHNPGDIFKIYEGGLSFHGALVGITVAFALFCRKHNLRFFHLMDKFVRIIPFGLAMGRIGNFMNNGELFGRITDAQYPWIMMFPNQADPRHPSQLYQSLGEGWALLLVLNVLALKKQREGTISAFFLIFYGIFRFIVEYFREADKQLGYYLGGYLTMGQILCLIMIFAGIALFVWSRGNVLEGSPEWQTRLDEFYKKQQAKLESQQVKA